MLKRVEKHLKRKEREDELGLDEETKDILGLNDTDSDESDSENDSDEGSDERVILNESEDDDVEVDEAEEGYDAIASEEEPDGEYRDERGLVTISEGLHKPIFIVSLDPDIKECIVCPGKVLKGPTMVEKHKTSNACTLHLSLTLYSD
jgi:hypothetical protein